MDSVVNSRLQAALESLREANASGRVARELAKEVGVEFTTVSRWIAGSRAPTGKSLQRLLAWADRQQMAPPRQAGAPSAGITYEQALGAFQLGYLMAQAKGVRKHIQFALDAQDQLIQSMQSFSAPAPLDLEGLDEAEAEEDARATQRDAVQSRRRKSAGE